MSIAALDEAPLMPSLRLNFLLCEVGLIPISWVVMRMELRSQMWNSLTQRSAWSTQRLSKCLTTCHAQTPVCVQPHARHWVHRDE